VYCAGRREYYGEIDDRYVFRMFYSKNEFGTLKIIVTLCKLINIYELFDKYKRFRENREYVNSTNNSAWLLPIRLKEICISMTFHSVFRRFNPRRCEIN